MDAFTAAMWWMVMVSILWFRGLVLLGDSLVWEIRALLDIGFPSCYEKNVMDPS